MPFPKMTLVGQRLCAQKVADVSAAVTKALQGLDLDKSAAPGRSVAVGIGSRGINHISLVASECVKFLKEKGFSPFVVPAMGSHGGNRPAGELSVLASLGITESTMGVPLQAAHEVVEIGRLDMDIPILMDRGAAEADHIVVINRIKPHTKFHGPIESGLTKMLTVGLGKGHGAALYHRVAIEHSFAVLQDAASQILKNRSILFGLAILENGYHDIAQISAVEPRDWLDQERLLLEKARSMLARIPFDPIDVLIIDEIGKDISGIGMDSNVTGRHRDLVGDFFTAPHVKRIFVRDLSPGTKGNGNGIGLADVTTQRLVEALDLEKTYTNALTAISPEKAAIPMHFDKDRQCLEACLKTIGLVEPEAARIVRVKNTLTLDKLLVSQALESEVTSNPDLHTLGPLEPMAFDHGGNLEPL
ncbi:MAG: lactate racemase domain-containing protein [Thermodesulfobacteriota bacterium]|nr:lactate racemase domain-containing protein [Thermodesulfobacteriota bacterium]